MSSNNPTSSPPTPHVTPPASRNSSPPPSSSKGLTPSHGSTNNTITNGSNPTGKSSSNSANSGVSSAATRLGTLIISPDPGKIPSVIRINPPSPSDSCAPTPANKDTPTLSSALVADPPINEENNNNKRKHGALSTPDSFNPRRFLPKYAGNKSLYELACFAIYYVLVIKELPPDIDADKVAIYLAEQKLDFSTIQGCGAAGKVLIKHTSLQDHYLSSRHLFPWGVICKHSINNPTADHSGQFRIALKLKESDIGEMTEPIIMIAGNLASIGAEVEGGNWSRTLPHVFNIYLATFDCVHAVLRDRSSITFKDPNTKRQFTALIKRQYCSFVGDTVKTVHVGNIKGDEADLEIESKIIEAFEGKNPPYAAQRFLCFARHLSTEPNSLNKPTNYGFAQVVGEKTQQWLIDQTFPGFKISATKPPSIRKKSK